MVTPILKTRSRLGFALTDLQLRNYTFYVHSKVMSASNASSTADSNLPSVTLVTPVSQSQLPTIMESSQEASAVAPSLDPNPTSEHLGLDSSDMLNPMMDTDFPANTTWVQNLIAERNRDGVARSILITLVALGKPYSHWEGIGHVYRNSHYVYESSTGTLAQSWYYTI
jgi:hypothetical protein